MSSIVTDISTSSKKVYLVTDIQEDFMDIPHTEMIGKWSDDKYLVKDVNDRVHFVPSDELPLWIGKSEGLDEEIAKVLSSNG